MCQGVIEYEWDNGDGNSYTPAYSEWRAPLNEPIIPNTDTGIRAVAVYGRSTNFC
jgi:hypothetical protein